MISDHTLKRFLSFKEENNSRQFRKLDWTKLQKAEALLKNVEAIRAKEGFAEEHGAEFSPLLFATYRET